MDFSVDNGKLRIGVTNGHKKARTDVTADGNPHHVALTFAGSNVTDCKFYVDGLLEVGTASQDGKAVNTASGTDVEIGTDFQSRFFNGTISEVAIWSRELSQAELQSHMNNGMTDALRTNLETHLAETVEFTPSTATTNGVLTATAVTNYGIESAGGNFTLKVYDPLDLVTSATIEGSTANLTGGVSNLSDYGTNVTTTYQWEVNTEPGLTFDGVDDYVSIPADTSSVNATFTDRTVSLWFKTDDLNQTEAIIYEQGGTSHGLSIYLDAGVLYVGGWTSGWNQWLSTSGASPSITLQANQWYHVTWMLNSTSGEFEFWLDGAQVSTVAGPSNGIALHTGGNGIGAIYSNSRIQAGGVAGSDLNHFKGQIDDIAIFDSALARPISKSWLAHCPN